MDEGTVKTEIWMKNFKVKNKQSFMRWEKLIKKGRKKIKCKRRYF